MTRLNRRTALLATAGGLAAPAFLPARAAATEKPVPPAIPPYRKLKLGAFTVTPLLAGTRVLDDPHGTFGTNASAEDFATVSQAAFLPTDKSLNSFIPVLIETGTEVVLFDTGLTPEGITAALAAAGKTPEEITTVVVTHMHGDHIGGLMAGDTVTFPNARYVTGQIEYDHWTTVGSDAVDAKVKPLAAKFSFIGDGDAPVPGITAVLAAGHTPGHMAYLIESEGRSLMLTADTANHYVWSVGQPDWEVRFDMDKAQAAATRKRLLGQIAEAKMPFIGYHMPFPGVGYLEASGPGFRFVPASYQFDL